jgi:hypothetical protein
MNTPEINSGNNVNSGFGNGADFQNILNFMSNLMAMRGGGQQPMRTGGQQPGGQYGGGPKDPKLNFISAMGPGSPAQTYFNDTGIIPMGNASGY